jgi:hypothetical protein
MTHDSSRNSLPVKAEEGQLAGVDAGRQGVDKLHVYVEERVLHVNAGLATFSPPRVLLQCRVPHKSRRACTASRGAMPRRARVPFPVQTSFCDRNVVQRRQETRTAAPDFDPRSTVRSPCSAPTESTG